MCILGFNLGTYNSAFVILTPCNRLRCKVGRNYPRYPNNHRHTHMFPAKKDTQAHLERYASWTELKFKRYTIPHKICKRICHALFCRDYITTSEWIHLINSRVISQVLGESNHSQCQWSKPDWGNGSSLTKTKHNKAQTVWTILGVYTVPGLLYATILHIQVLLLSHLSYRIPHPERAIFWIRSHSLKTYNDIPTAWHSI